MKEIDKVRKILDGISMCPKCKSFKVIKHGTRWSKRWVSQRYKCKKCGRYFSDKL